MVYDVFFIIGAVLIVGFFTNQIFERTKFPDILLLMLIGMLLGPVLKLVSIEGAISSLTGHILRGCYWALWLVVQALQ